MSLLPKNSVCTCRSQQPQQVGMGRGPALLWGEGEDQARLLSTRRAPGTHRGPLLVAGVRRSRLSGTVLTAAAPPSHKLSTWLWAICLDSPVRTLPHHLGLHRDVIFSETPDRAQVTPLRHLPSQGLVFVPLLVTYRKPLHFMVICVPSIRAEAS